MLRQVIFSRVTEYRRDQTGAITVDWVVLTGVIVGLAYGVGALVLSTDSAEVVGNNGQIKINEYLADY